MRPLRLLLTLLTTILSFSLLLYISPFHSDPVPSTSIQSQSRLRTYFSWHTPSSLFPPSAIISLTDDNSTFFLARPAAFGPLIPVRSVSAQLWVGSGFGDERFGRGEGGELGCSDVPGWEGGYVGSGGKTLGEVKKVWQEGREGRNRKRDVSEYDVVDNDEDDEEQAEKGPEEGDGTDDHLHHPLPASEGIRNGGAKKAAHADIQSLQESAEIAGNIVLLSRGGCGFLEKVKWVQRRGGIALIVGDDIRGGPLVTMYARGDTSNVTIPSLFTSHTTAHLLSSLIPSGRRSGQLSAEETARLGAVLGSSHQKNGEHENEAVIDKPQFTASSTMAKPTTVVPNQGDQSALDEAISHNVEVAESSGWLSSLFRKSDQRSPDVQVPDRNVGWVLQEEFDDEEVLKYGKKQTTNTQPASAPSGVPGGDSGDGFVIGIQDWRDPDLVAHQREQLQASTSVVSTKTAQSSGLADAMRVDSITPGSGEYAKHHAVDTHGDKDASQKDSSRKKQKTAGQGSKGWLARLFSSDDEAAQSHESQRQSSEHPTTPPSHTIHDQTHTANRPKLHEGLWVTLTPTSMSTSPLFDTLLVLVVSPLVTLTVVYALLLLRSRIRRRRWRAPKSVVERLPVRTYQTMATPTATSSTTSSISSPISATTPLLPSNARPINARSRPRSRTTPEGPGALASSSLRSEGGLPSSTPSLEQIEEKRAAGLSEWRRRYGGKQRECVVCLEEYIDGVSRVMSLPCGHEFHAECITPWLTTRRRTCPICKGDVVRSLARSSGSSAAASPPTALNSSANDEEEPLLDADEVQEQAAVARNDDPEAARPISREEEMFEDLERGDRSR